MIDIFSSLRTTYLQHLLVSVGLGGFLFLQVPIKAQTWQGTKVRLAASTFTPEERQALQPVADHVAQLVDQLIPGKPEGYPTDGIVVFEAPGRWKTLEFATQYDGPPVTLNGLRVFDEPPETAGNTIRIALNELPRPNALSLSYQLAHELGHVKLGTRTDNYLDETFVVALSLEVLRLLGYEGYMLACEGQNLMNLPPVAQEAIASEKWADARAYWLKQSKAQGPRVEDRGFETLGAMLILRNRRRVRWSALLNASSGNVCSDTAPAHILTRCDPDISKMARQLSLLQPLGLERDR